MSSCIMKNPDSDDEVDLEALRLAALKSRKPKYARVNHNNLIPIVPVTVDTPDFVHTKIKKEKVSPTPDDNVQGTGNQLKGVNKENEEEKGSNYSTSTVENDQDILSMDDKEEEDSLERLMDQLEAEISGKAPLPTNRIVLSSKNSTSGKKDRKRKTKKTNEGGDDEIELVQVKSGREPGAVIEIRESASPETFPKEANPRKSGSREPLKRRSRSRLRSRSRSPFSRARSYRRSRSPYWSRSPRRSRSPFRRSRSPFWMSRRSRSSSRSLFSRRYRSPVRRRSPFARFSRSRSRSFDRRRSPWSLSPRRRSKSPLYGMPLPRRRNFNSPLGRRRSFSPRDGSKSPRRRSRSPRRFPRNSPFRRSKTPFRRSRSPIRRSPIRRSQTPYLNRSKSPFSKLNSPNRSPLSRTRHSKTPPRRLSLEKASSKPRSKSPVNKLGSSPRRSPGRLVSKDARDFRFSTSPTPRRNRSPLRVVEKNKQDDRNESYRGRNRNEKRHRSLSRENRRSNRQRYFRKFSPSKSRKSSERQSRKSKSPKPKEGPEKSKEGSKQTLKEKEPSPTPSGPPDPVLEARKKKFENLNEVDPTKDKKISLKSIKETSDNVEEDEEALTINVEGNLWDESEESEDEFESRFKSNEARKNLPVAGNRTVLSFRNLREGGDAASRKINLNKPLTDDRRDRFGSRSDRHDRWQGRRSERRKRNYPEGSKSRSEDDTSSKSKRSGDRVSSQRNSRSRDFDRRSDRKPIVWGKRNEGKAETKDNEVSTTLNEGKGEKSSHENKDKQGKGDADLHDADDFDKLISDFEKELESDICISTKEPSSTVGSVQSEVKRSKISVKKDVFEPEVGGGFPVKRSTHRAVKLCEPSSNKPDKEMESKSLNKPAAAVDAEKVEESQEKDGPEDYVEDDDFFLEVNARQKPKSKGEEEDSQSDLRAVLSRRRNERLTKAVSLQENMPTRLVQSAFQGLGNKKSNRQIREVQEALEVPSFDRSVKSTGGEGRRVLLLQREKNPSVPSVKCTVPEVKPDTTIYQRFTRSTERRKRKLQRQLDPVEDVDQEEEEEGFEVEEEKQSRRFRLKRNVTLSSQVCLEIYYSCFDRSLIFLVLKLFILYFTSNFVFEEEKEEEEEKLHENLNDELCTNHTRTGLIYVRLPPGQSIRVLKTRVDIFWCF